MPHNERVPLVSVTASGVVLGRSTEPGAGADPVVLPTLYRRQGMTVTGLQGSGKTELLKSCILQDVARGAGAVVLDAHGDLTDELLSVIPEERAGDIVLLDASDRTHAFGINIFDCPERGNPVARQATIDQAITLFKHVFAAGEFAAWGHRLEDVLYNLFEVILDNPTHTLADVLAFLADAGLRERLLVNVSHADVRAFWLQYGQLTPAARATLTGSTTNKLRRFTTHRLVRHIVGQATTVDLRTLIDSNRIVLIKLPVGIIGDEAVALLGAFLIGECLRAMLARADTRERPDVALYADECHRFASDDFVKLLEEARKYGVATVLATQRLDKLRDAREAALGAINLVVFQVVPEDARALVGRFKLQPKPGPLVRQRVMRRIYRDWDEIVWDPPAAADEHAACLVQRERLRRILAVIPRGEPDDFLPVALEQRAAGAMGTSLGEWGLGARARAASPITLRLEEQLERGRHSEPELVEQILGVIAAPLAHYRRRLVPWYQPSASLGDRRAWPARAASSVDLGVAWRAPLWTAPAPEPEVAAYLALRHAASAHELAAVDARLVELWACRTVVGHHEDTGLEEPVSHVSLATGRLAPTYAWQPGPLESRAATREAFVERLTTLAPYHAVVRARVGEQEFWQGEIVPPYAGPVTLDEAQMARRRAQSRAVSCRSRADIEREIWLRQQSTQELALAAGGDTAVLSRAPRRGPVLWREVVG